MPRTITYSRESGDRRSITSVTGRGEWPHNQEGAIGSTPQCIYRTLFPRLSSFPGRAVEMSPRKNAFHSDGVVQLSIVAARLHSLEITPQGPQAIVTIDVFTVWQDQA